MLSIILNTGERNLHGRGSQSAHHICGQVGLRLSARAGTDTGAPSHAAEPSQKTLVFQRVPATSANRFMLQRQLPVNYPPDPGRLAVTDGYFFNRR